MRASALFTTVLLAMLLLTGKTQELTQPADDEKVGWENAPDRRGTLELIWSCLSTVIACTWSILHLNVPSQKDSTCKRILRKIKWLIFTILFPEFVFAHAVGELKMALDDLHAMHMKKERGEGLGEWKVEFGKGLRCLHSILNIATSTITPSITALDSCVTNISSVKPEGPNNPLLNINLPESIQQTSVAKSGTNPPLASRNPAQTSKQRFTEGGTWTLVHSYFGNMGGMRFPEPQSEDLNHCEFITSYMLVNCCIGTLHDPLPTLRLSREEIEDKSKADWFLKLTSVGQISWLVLSVAVRSARKMPVTQLEIATLAFSIIAIATYLANWFKPKDVNQSVYLSGMEGKDVNHYGPQGWKSFSRILMTPSRASSVIYWSHGRITNDNVRGNGLVSSVWILMASSSAIFGGLHCLAWTYAFPTTAELLIWRIASIASSILPVLALIISALILLKVRRLVAAMLKSCSTEISEAKNISEAWWRALQDPSVHEEIPSSFRQQIGSGMFSFLAVVKELHRFSKALNEQKPSLDTIFSRLCTLFKELNDLTDYEYEWDVFESHVLNKFLLNEDDYFPKGLLSWWNITIGPQYNNLAKHIMFWNRLAQVFAIMIFIIYGIARLTLIILCFSSLRLAPDAIYITTWTGYLPNIS